MSAPHLIESIRLRTIQQTSLSIGSISSKRIDNRARRLGSAYRGTERWSHVVQFKIDGVVVSRNKVVDYLNHNASERNMVETFLNQAINKATGR